MNKQLIGLLLASLWISFAYGTPLQTLPEMKPQYIELSFPLEKPIFLTYTKDLPDLIFIACQDGQIHYLSRKDKKHYGLCLDLGSQVRRNHSEEGLLGIAMHPSFNKNGYLYVHYSANSPRRNIISRFTWDATRHTFNTESEKTILEVNQPYGNHNGGMIAFGKDNYFYISLGDGGHAGDPHNYGQNLQSLLGKLLRIDINTHLPYTIPNDNPFYDDPVARKEIFAYGLRNMWRFSFDSLTGEIWGGDVGQNAFEEIDLILKGRNYGWSYYEGYQTFKPVKDPGQNFESPLTVHPRSEAQSITGGYVYRGKIKEWYGIYIYGDFVTGNLWAMTKESKPVLVGKIPFISSFGEDADGQLYALSYFEGKIYKLI